MVDINPSLQRPYAEILKMVFHEPIMQSIIDCFGHRWLVEKIEPIPNTNYNWCSRFFCCQNSVRHNLSLNKCFEKIDNPKSAGGTRKGCLWGLNPLKVDKMDDEICKWRKKDPAGIKRSMAKPGERRGLVRGGAWWETGLGGRRGLVRGGAWWETGLGGRWGLVGDGAWWETGLGGRRGLVGGGVWWEVGLGGRRGLVGGGALWETGLGGRWGLVGDGAWWEAGLGGRRGLVRVGAWWEVGLGQL